MNPSPLCPRFLLAILLLISAILFPPSSDAAPSARSAHTDASLVSSAAFMAPGTPFTIALRLKMDPHWHTYWKNPGDSGLATSIQWTLPDGFQAGPIQWPAPQRIETSGLVSYGYEGEVLLLTEITPPAGLKPGQTVELKARVDWLECEDICKPGKAELSLRIPVAAAPRLQLESLFETARNRLPRPAPNAATFTNSGTHLLLRIALPETKTEPVLNAWFYPDTEELVAYGLPQETDTTSTPGTLQIRIPKSEGAKSRPLSGVLRLETNQGTLAYEIPPTPLDGPTASPASFSSSSTSSSTAPGFAAVLLLGFVGGLILNLMPCVFPVLGIKVMGLVRQGGESRTRTAQHGLAYTAGVLLSFWILAGILLALREGGSQLGWGFQLQSPGFVFVLCALLLAFGLNMSGVFEVGTSLIGIGNGASAGLSSTSQPSFGGSFLSGILATVVATPCAAPFLAPALGAALALPVFPSLVLFTAIALGLALPFLLLALFPQLTRFLPRPGAWMESFKQGLAFLLYAAAGYLLWVLAGQVSESAQLSVILGLVALAAATWIYGRWSTPVHTTTVRRTATLLALVLGLAGLAYGWPRTESSGAPTWEPWSAERTAALVQEGRPVYVDFTARWCATCQVNKKVVFGSDELLQVFRDRNVATLKADWTNQDATITAELARWGRSAVPFNLLYLPGRKDPIVLPEILTPSIVLDALVQPQPAR